MMGSVGFGEGLDTASFMIMIYMHRMPEDS